MKNIVKLLIKCVCVMLPMIVIYIYTWVNPLAYMDEEAPHYLWNKEIVNSGEDFYYDTIILGDSMANAAYMPEILSDTAINLSLGGMTPVENYYVLQDWLRTHSAPKVCYISFQDAHFVMQDCFWTRTMYAHRFRTEQSREILRTAEIFQEVTFLTENYWTDFISYELRLPNKYIASLMNAGFNQRYEQNVESQKMDELHRGRYVARGADEFKGGERAALEEFYANPLFEDYYRRLIGMCVDHGIQVRIIKLPHPENVSYTEEYIAQYQEFYDRLKADYPGITVDWIATYDKKCFMDANHLNTYGALRLSSDIKELYPDDFGNAPLSKRQVEAVSDSIRSVKRGEQLTEWIAGRDYTIYVNDGTQIFFFLFLGGQESRNEVCRLEQGLAVKREAADAWQWEEPVIGDYTVAVMDNYNQKLVCQKSFWKEGDTYYPAE